MIILINPPSFTRKGKRVRLSPPEDNIVLIPWAYAKSKVKIRKPV
jgi:hypothetical protein